MAMKARMKGGARNTITSLQVMVKATEPQWATPTPPNGGRGMPEGTSSTGTMPDGRKRTVGLENQVKAPLWPTPMAGTPAQNGNNAAGNTDFSRKAEELARAIWPTPASRDHKGENSADHLTAGTGRKHMDQLPNAVAHGFTRPAQPRQSDGPTFLERLRTSRQLRAYLIASHGRASWRRLWKARKARRLNPGFVEWLMAWPEGHALCAGSAMAFTHWQQDMRGALSRLPTASGPWIWTPP